MGVITAPVVGFGSTPVCTARGGSWDFESLVLLCVGNR